MSNPIDVRQFLTSITGAQASPEEIARFFRYQQTGAQGGEFCHEGSCNIMELLKFLGVK